MTEDEAKTKVCCGPGHAGERPPREPRILCIGSACMAWRIEERNAVDFVRIYCDESDPGAGTMTVLREDARRHDWKVLGDQVPAIGGGYCGLAGAPQ